MAAAGVNVMTLVDDKADELEEWLAETSCDLETLQQDNALTGPGAEGIPEMKESSRNLEEVLENQGGEDNSEMRGLHNSTEEALESQDKERQWSGRQPAWTISSALMAAIDNLTMVQAGLAAERKAMGQGIRRYNLVITDQYLRYEQCNLNELSTAWEKMPILCGLVGQITHQLECLEAAKQDRKEQDARIIQGVTQPQGAGNQRKTVKPQAVVRLIANLPQNQQAQGNGHQGNPLGVPLRVNKRGESRCFRCQDPGHWKHDCPMATRTNSECFACQGTGLRRDQYSENQPGQGRAMNSNQGPLTHTGDLARVDCD